ncbi:MAG TPA: hypothetical protein VGH33_28700, partial [Isosphaeraceae bacterium]
MIDRSRSQDVDRRASGRRGRRDRPPRRRQGSPEAAGSAAGSGSFGAGDGPGTGPADTADIVVLTCLTAASSVLHSA